MLIPDHHPGFIDWRTYEANQDRIAQNTRPGPHKAGGAVRKGALCCKALPPAEHLRTPLAHTHYRGRNSAPGYHCPGKIAVRGLPPASIASTSAASRLTKAVTPRPSSPPSSRQKLAATVAAVERLEADRETSAQAVASRRRAGKLQKPKPRQERRYRAVDPDNRLVARGLERRRSRRSA